MTDSTKLTLVLGGARSGKTAHAMSLADAAALRRVYVATAQPLDDEMAARIAHHRAERGDGWRTIEQPLDLAGALSTVAAGEAVMIDCLTLWLSNVMHHQRDVAEETDSLITALRGHAGPLFLVSNEVGLGLVPDTPLGRDFRDRQGRLNQQIAAVADRVIFVAAGLPLVLKQP